MLHKNLTKERWQKLSFIEQMANVGAEVGRAINCRGKDLDKSQKAFERAIELLDLTIQDQRNHNSRLIEICRVKEELVDYFISGDKNYSSTDKKWNDYFYSFNYALALRAGS